MPPPPSAGRACSHQPGLGPSRTPSPTDARGCKSVRNDGSCGPRLRGRVRRVLGAVAVGALVAGVPSAARAVGVVAAAPSASLFTDGTVFAVAAARDRTYVGGNFTLIGRPTGSWVGVDARGAPVPGRPLLHGSVAAAVRDARGGWFIAG